MPELIQLGVPARERAAPPAPILWLQSITLLWMLAELAISARAAFTAHSPALLAFASDSLVELLSAAVVLLQFLPALRVSDRLATRAAAILLYALAAIVAVIALTTLLQHKHPNPSRLGIAITIAALIVMPLLATLKRRHARRTGSAALAADAVQSATCAYLALITLVGLALNAIFHARFHVGWIDPAAALLALPILLHEANQARRGHTCACC
jgi:divalent metal cation (Fe/Co/Zn/Cd) transporter